MNHQQEEYQKEQLLLDNMNFKEYFLKEDLGDFFKRDAGKEALRFAKKLVPIGKGSYVGQAAGALKELEGKLKGGGKEDKVQRDAAEAAYKGGPALQKFFEAERRKLKDPKKVKSAEDEAIKLLGNFPLKLKHPNEGEKTYTGMDHYANVVLDQFRRYLVDKRYGQEDAAQYTVNGFINRTDNDSIKNKNLLKILKNNGLLYKEIAKFVS
ncbi:MAG: hypothetical protein ACW964_18745 [Candidatus Hodarchaeales archaeon]